MHGIRSAGLSLGRGVVICGAGPIGLIALAAARASGAHPLVITDIEPRRLAFAKVCPQLRRLSSEHATGCGRKRTHNPETLWL
jgi:threonine dehydrogenase-like Zn-dependent dehydrogenase